MSSTLLKKYIEQIPRPANLTTTIPLNIGSLKLIEPLIDFYQNNSHSKFYVNFYIIYSKLCIDYFSHCKEKNCLPIEKIASLDDMDFAYLEVIKMKGSMSSLERDIVNQKIDTMYNEHIIPLLKINDIISLYIEGKLGSGSMRISDNVRKYIDDVKGEIIGEMTDEKIAQLIMSEVVDPYYLSKKKIIIAYIQGKLKSGENKKSLSIDSIPENILMAETSEDKNHIFNTIIAPMYDLQSTLLKRYMMREITEDVMADVPQDIIQAIKKKIDEIKKQTNTRLLNLVINNDQLDLRATQIQEIRLKTNVELTRLIKRYMSGKLKNDIDKIPINILDKIDELMNINKMDRQKNNKSLLTLQKKWITCMVYENLRMRYNFYNNKCNPDKKTMTLPSTECKKKMLYLEPLYKLITLFFNFRYDDNDKDITVFPNTPCQDYGDGRIQNEEIEIIDLFIVSGCLKQLFDIILKLFVVDNTQTHDYEFIDKVIIDICNEKEVLRIFFTDPTHKKHYEDLKVILILTYESNRTVKCYNPNDSEYLPLYIIGDYLMHRIKKIDYSNFDKLASFREFYIMYDRIPESHRMETVKKIISYFSIGTVRILDYITVPWTWNSRKKDFANCVETTILNLIDILYRDKTTGKIIIPDESPDDIKAFFNEYDSQIIDKTYTKDKLIEWTHLLMKLDNILFNNVVESKTSGVKGWDILPISILNLLLILTGQSTTDTVETLKQKSIVDIQNELLDRIKTIKNDQKIISYENGKIIIDKEYILDLTTGHGEIKLKNSTGTTANLTESVGLYDIIKNASIYIGYEFITTDGLYINNINKNDIIMDTDRPKFIGSKCFYGTDFSEFSGTKLCKIIGDRILVALPEGIIYIGCCAFSYAFITGLSIPNSVKEIGYKAFIRCQINVCIISTTYSQLRKIGDFAFFNSLFSKFDLPNSVEEIGIGCFYDCVNMVSFILDQKQSKLKSIGDYSFMGNIKLRDFILPNNVKRIGRHAFRGCQSMRYLNIDQKETKLIEIDEYAFYAAGLKILQLPDSVEIIGNYCFYKCAIRRLLDVAPFLSKLIEIGSYAFYMSQLVKFRLSNSVVKIGECAFEGCTVLKTLEIDCKNSKLEIIGKNSFVNTGLNEVYLPYSVKEYEDAFAKNIKIIRCGMPIQDMPATDHKMPTITGGSRALYWKKCTKTNKMFYLNLCL